MDKRIKIICYFSIITMLLILGGQIYWLSNQYKYSYDKYAKQLTEDCKILLEQEQIIRHKESYKDKKVNHPTVRLNIIIHMRNTRDLHNAEGTFTIYSGKKKRSVYIRKISSDDASIIANRVFPIRYQQFRPHTMDSLFVAKGYEVAVNYCFYNSKKLFICPAIYNESKRLLHVKYSYNPLSCESVCFDLKIPTAKIINNMAWQLAGSILLLFILTFCLLYQIRTIIFQKRIDSLRHEFMKNMIYEMKQPPTDDNITDEAIHIGDTEFFYSLNELRNGTERVIITSRQAEILKLLTDTPNEVVPRETILRQVWGDDSYANSLALNVQITYLRRALKSDEKLCIEAIMKKGYVLKITD